MRLRYTRAFSTACKTSDIFKNQKRPQWRFATGRCGHRPLRGGCRAGSYGSRTQHTSPSPTKGGCASRAVTTHPRRYARVGASIARPRYNPPNCSTPMQIRTRLGLRICIGVLYFFRFHRGRPMATPTHGYAPGLAGMLAHADTGDGSLCRNILPKTRLSAPTQRTVPYVFRCRAGPYGSRTQHTSPFTTKSGCASRTVTTHPRRYAHVGASNVSRET